MQQVPRISVTGELLHFAARYPLPFFALAGLVSGLVLTFAFGMGDLGRIVWYATLIIGGVPIIISIIRGIIERRFAVDIIAMLAIVAAILLDESFAGVIIVLMQSSGVALERYGLDRASYSLRELLSRAPKTAHRKIDKTLEDVDVSEVNVGDVLVVKHGDLIPVDGTILSGQGEIDESALTGEPMPRSKASGDAVMSGSINIEGAFEMKADRRSAESQYSKIVEMVKEAQKTKAPIQRIADKYGTWFTPLTILVALFGWYITGNIATILAVLVVATPCPLILATPIAIMGGINRSAKRGIIVKSGGAVEQLGETDIIFFDKTGTLTYGKPLVDKIIPLTDYTEDELLRIAGSLEQMSSHPVAIAVAEKAREQYQKLPFPDNFAETPGRGVKGTLEGREVVIGSRKFGEEVTGQKATRREIEMERNMQLQGKLVTCIVIDGVHVGLIVFSDLTRAGVPQMIERLRQLGINEAVMLTGDNVENANIIAREAGITHFEANLSPERKTFIMESMKGRYKSTVMVGDGINDAPALATATVGIAMGARGTAISAETSDVVLTMDDVTKVVDAIQIGKRTIKIAKQSIVMGISISAVLMGIASLGYIDPAIGAVLQEGIDAVSIFNALRAGFG